MVLTSRVKVASSVKVCVKTAPPVTSQPENVIMDVVITGLGHIVKVFEKFLLLIFARHNFVLLKVSIFN